MKTNRSFLVNKQNLSETRQSEADLPDLNDGQVLFKIERYAFTANNITYAVCGESLRYWDFFPADDAAWGIIPVWGYGEVADSKWDAAQIGERFYGYFPTSDFLVVEPGKANALGFADASAHRQKLAAVYNFYTNLSADNYYDDDAADYIPLLKPLFATAFLLYHFLRDAEFFNTEQIITTSASSKTALALAFMLRQNRAADGKTIIGLTSNANAEFLRSTGYFDRIVTYDEAESLPTLRAVAIDFAGNAALLHRIAAKLGDNLAYISRIGITDWKADKAFDDLPNVHGFFAPTHIAARQKEWGALKTAELINGALAEFIGETKQQIEIRHVNGFGELPGFYAEMLNGRIDPKIGCIVKI